YWNRGRAVGAVRMLGEARAGDVSVNLDHLLRHHAEEAVSDGETYQRDSFDFILANYSRLETAALIGYVPDTFPEAFRRESLWNLSHAAVRRYYETHYPVLLPRLFRWRLEGKLALREKDENE